MSLSADKIALKEALETYGKQIDLEITRGTNATASGETLYITDAYKRDNSLTLEAKSKNILNLGSYSAISFGTYDESNNTITSSFTDWYYSYIQYTNLNEELMAHRGEPLTFSVKSIPEGTRISFVISGTRSNGTTYQELGGTTGLRTVTGIISTDFTEITRFEIRLNQKSTLHTPEPFTFEELQVEFNNTSTEYTPYITDLTSVNVTRRGKNLFNVDRYTNSKYYVGDGLFVNPNAADETNTQREYIGIPITDIWDISNATGQKITISFDLRAETAGRVQIYAVGEKRITTAYMSATEDWQRFSHTAELTTNPNDANGDVCNLSFFGTYGTGVIPYVKNIQIELGEESTELEAYDGQNATADANGIFKGLTTTTPTIITSNTAGIILHADYKTAIIYHSEDIVSCTQTFEGGLLTSIMKEAEVELDGVGGPEFAKAIKGEKIYITMIATAGEIIGKKELGTFVIKDAQYQDDTNSVILTCYDLMIYSMVEYIPVVELPIKQETEEEEIEEGTEEEGTEAQTETTETEPATEEIVPVTLGEYLQAICNYLGIELATPTFINSDVIIDEEKYNAEYTFRDVLTEIAQAAGGSIAIKNDKLYVIYPTESGVTIEPSNLKSIAINEIYGPINSVVLARTPQEDNIYKKDDTAEEICEIRIENNQIMDTHREDFIDGLYEALNGLAYCPHEIESYGIGILDIGDIFTIETLDGTTYTGLYISGDIEISQGLVERTRAAAPETAETEYKAASETDRKLNKTILRVDKQEQEIQALVTKTENTKNELTGQVEEITKSVEQKITPEQVQILITETVNGIDSVTTSTGYTFGQDGLHIQKDGEEIENKLDHTGMYVNRGDDNVLTANAEGVQAINLTAKQYLTIGKNSRLEDYGENRTACFYIGG